MGDVSRRARRALGIAGALALSALGQSSVGPLVSVHTLAHKVPKAALKELERARAAVASGKLDEAVRRCQTAIGLDPLWAGAHNGLGVASLRAHDPSRAVDEFRRAVDLEPESPRYQGNLGAALIAMGRFADAERAARKALALDPADAKGEYVLGLSLAVQNRELARAAELLKSAEQTYPDARRIRERLQPQ